MHLHVAFSEVFAGGNLLWEISLVVSCIRAAWPSGYDLFWEYVTR